MFDPPDYPYKDLADSLRDDLLFSNECTTLPPINLSDSKLINEENKSFQQNDSGRFFNNELVSLGTVNAIDKDQNAELLVLQSENYSPTLLDENTVNQFLLPLQDCSGETSKNGADDKGPDLLALQSCVLCHEIFITEADLLDHTISVHTCDDGNNDSQNILQLSISNDCINSEDVNSNTTGFETEWLVCGVCDRVLSTALEVEPTDQLCCSDNIDNARVTKRRLDTMYVCDLCSGLFAGGESLDKHKASCVVQNEPYKYAVESLESTTNESINSPQCPDVLFACDLCEKRCDSAAELKSHLNTCDQFSHAKNGKHSFQSRANSKMWNCGSCNQLFATARELYRHKRGEDRPPGAPLTAFVCEECDKVLGSMCALHTHRKMHKVTKPGYPCRICGRRFNQSGHLAIHMRMHTGERPYPCDLCPKAFKVKVERDDHRRTHTGERPFACTACPKTFTAAARLREHARIHTDQRPYRCEICGAAFRRPYARTVHTLIHTGEKPHECDVCGTAFRRSGDMWKHKRTIHGTQLAYEEGKTM